jgi:HD-like signal output (HDOD) protein
MLNLPFLIMFALIKYLLRAVISQSRNPLFQYYEGCSSSITEKVILGIDPTQIGSDLARRWTLPESLIDIIRYHHRPEDATRHVQLAHMVYLAGSLMTRFNAGLELERLDTKPLSARLTAIGSSKEKFSEIVDLIPAGVFESSPELDLVQK